MTRKFSGLAGYIFLLSPALLLLFFFFIVPVFAALFFSLTDQMLVGQGIDEVSFIGLDNYLHLFTDSQVYLAFLNTLLLVLSAIVIQQIAGFVIAVMLSDKSPVFRKIVHGCLYSGSLMPEAGTAFIFFILFSIDGMVNNALGSLGRASVVWLADTPLQVIILAQVWSGTAYSLITYENTLSLLPGKVLDAARSDGASEWQILLFIIIPSIRNTIRSNSTMLVLNNLGVFGLIYMLTGGGPLFKSTNLPVLVFRNSISGSATGYGLALSFILFVLSFFVSLFNRSVVNASLEEAE